MEHDFEVTEYRPGKSYKVRSTSGPFPVAMTYTVEQAGHATKLRVVTEAEPGGLLAMAGPLLNIMVKKQFETDHNNLKRLLESGQSD